MELKIKLKKLKKCPFCGSDVELEEKPLWYGNHHGYQGCYEYIIKCPNHDCGCTLDYWHNDTIYRPKEEAINNVIEKWNKRK